jgi:hypothetical protein
MDLFCFLYNTNISGYVDGLKNHLRVVHGLFYIKDSMVHYQCKQAIQHIGPLIEYWCTRYEGFHKRTKAVTKICNNFKNMPKTVSTKIQIMNCRHLHRSKKKGINNHDASIIWLRIRSKTITLLHVFSRRN